MSRDRDYAYTLAYPESMGGHVFYIGKGIGKRLRAHEQEARRGVKSHKCSVIRKIWANEEQVVKTKVAFFQTHEDALEYEQALIFLMRPYGHLTNLTDGGDGLQGLVRTAEHRRKIGDAHKGRIRSEAERRNLSLAKRGHSPSEKELEHLHKMHVINKGRTHSEAELRKMRLARKGRTHSEESRRKMSLAHRGKPLSEKQLEHLRKMSLANKGSTHSEEHRRKNSEAHKGATNTAESRRKMSLAHKGSVAPNKGKPHTEETRRKISEAAKRREAQRREQDLQAMREPISSPTDAEWKQGVQALSLWETNDSSGWPTEVLARLVTAR